MNGRGITDRSYMEACLKEAWYALKENRLRTMMSIIGVAVGIAAVVTVNVVSEGGRQLIFAELETFGLNTIWIYRKHEQTNPLDATREGSGITNDDYAQMGSECCPSVLRYSPVVYLADYRRSLRVGNNFSKSAVEGVGVDYLAINRDELTVGRNFSERDITQRRDVAIIGEVTSKRLFGDFQSPIGKMVRMDNTRFLIIGVLKFKHREFLSSIGATQGYDINDRLLVPYTVYQQQIGKDDIHTLQAEAISQDLVEPAMNQIISALERSHRQRFTYQADNMKPWIATAERILSNVSLIGLVAASVSLLVGGIGIMNIMSTSIIERTREIGLRKAIGATRSDILNQFLIESAYISTLGGMFGLLLAAGVLGLLHLWTGFLLFPSISVILTAVLISMLVGILSGLYPANRAAKLLPMQALRYE
jgi:ABC-type antimicrobial peptide transport system permease subunit